jgi:hypothetical protein
MKLLKKYGIQSIMILFFWLFIAYNSVFIRSDTKPGNIEKTIGPKINAVPYTTYFDIQQKQPSTFFTTPAFPSYTQRCHEKKKLCTLIPLQQLYADMQWLGSIQFVWSQPVPNMSWELSTLLDNLSTLAPYRDYPYIFGQLLIPLNKNLSDELGKDILQKSRNDAKALAERGEMYTCDSKKVAKIVALDENVFIDVFYSTWSKEDYQDPCITYERAHYAGFNAFYYRKQATEAANNYKISSFTRWSPGLAPIMAALVYGRGGEHIKSASIRYDRHIALSSQDQSDEIIAKETKSNLQKAVFELQLQLITDADDASSKSCKKSFSCLERWWHIKASIQKSFNDICGKGIKTDNLRCRLLNIGLKNWRISLDGELIYPVESGWKFTWSDEYGSRWITPKQ